MLHAIWNHFRTMIGQQPPAKPSSVDLTFRMTVLHVPDCNSVEVCQHPHEDALSEYVFALLPDETEVQSIEEHLEHCQRCNVIVDNLVKRIYRFIYSDDEL